MKYFKNILQVFILLFLFSVNVFAMDFLEECNGVCIYDMNQEDDSFTIQGVFYKDFKLDDGYYLSCFDDYYETHYYDIVKFDGPEVEVLENGNYLVTFQIDNLYPNREYDCSIGIRRYQNICNGYKFDYIDGSLNFSTGDYEFQNDMIRDRIGVVHGDLFAHGFYQSTEHIYPLPNSVDWFRVSNTNTNGIGNLYSFGFDMNYDTWEIKNFYIRKHGQDDRDSYFYEGDFNIDLIGMFAVNLKSDFDDKGTTPENVCLGQSLEMDYEKDILERLVDARFEALCDNGRTPLFYSMENTMVDFPNAFISRGFNPGDPEEVDYLVELFNNDNKANNNLKLTNFKHICKEEIPYSDLTKDHEYFDEIMYLTSMDILDGYEDGTIQPYMTINRAELLKIIAAPMKDEFNETHKNCFPDVNDEWFAPYVCFAKEKGWINGYLDGTFRPDQDLTKVEALKMVLEARYEMPDYQYQVIPQYDDVYPDKWYAEYVYSAKRLGMLEPIGANYYPETIIVRGEVFHFMYKLDAFHYQMASPGYFAWE